MTASPLQTDFFPVKWSTRHVFIVTFNRTPFLSMQGQRIVFERHFDRCSSFSKAANANARYKQALKKRIFLEIIDLFGFTILPSWWIVVCPACVLAVRRELSFKNSILSRNFRNSNLEIDVILSELFRGDDTSFDFRKQRRLFRLIPTGNCSDFKRLKKRKLCRK